MKTPVTLKLVTEIRDGLHLEVVTFAAHGMLFRDDDSATLLYEEKLQDIGLVKTAVKVKAKQAAIMRTGAISMRQVLIKGETMTGHYISPAGKMDLETKAEVITYEHKPKSKTGKIELAYTLKLQGQQARRHRIIFTFKEVTE